MNRKVLRTTPANMVDTSELEEKMKKSETTVFWKDVFSFVLLLLLYMLQGIPMGFGSSIPLILMEHDVSYEALSLFSLVSLPFSLKIIWAPIVDTFYVPSFGRRKTWLVPIQLLTGLVMICGAPYVSAWLREDQIVGGNTSSVSEETLHASHFTNTSYFNPNAEGVETDPTPSKIGVEMLPLTAYFFMLYFLMATQDIAVDGWALTMLSKDNVGYASVANAVGQTFGILISNQGFLALSDNQWCLRFLNRPALTSLSGFMSFWGYIFVFITLLVWFFKKEEKDSDESSATSMSETIYQIWSLCKLQSISTFCLVLFTCKAAFASMDAAFLFKLQEYGLRKSDLTTVTPILMVTSLLFPAIVSRHVASRSLESFLFGIKCKLLTSILMWVMFQYSARTLPTTSTPDHSYFTLLLATMILNECAGNLVFVSCMSFFSKISDPSIGGSYMTLLNTMANLGSKWPSVLSLYLIPKLTIFNGPHSGQHDVKHVHIDGITILFFVGIIIGVLWLMWFGPVLMKLQQVPRADWMVSASSKLT